MNYYIMYCDTISSSVQNVCPMVYTNGNIAITDARAMIKEYPTRHIMVTQAHAYVRMDCVTDFYEHKDNESKKK